MIGVLVLAGAFNLTSPAFKEAGNIPSKFTCDAGQQNPSPALAWNDAPAAAKSFVLIMHDPDAPMAGGFTQQEGQGNHGIDRFSQHHHPVRRHPGAGRHHVEPGGPAFRRPAAPSADI